MSDVLIVALFSGAAAFITWVITRLRQQVASEKAKRSTESDRAAAEERRNEFEDARVPTDPRRPQRPEDPALRLRSIDEEEDDRLRRIDNATGLQDFRFRSSEVRDGQD